MKKFANYLQMIIYNFEEDEVCTVVINHCDILPNDNQLEILFTARRIQKNLVQAGGIARLDV